MVRKYRTRNFPLITPYSRNNFVRVYRKLDVKKSLFHQVTDSVVDVRRIVFAAGVPHAFFFSLEYYRFKIEIE